MFGLRHEGNPGRVETVEVVVELFDELVELLEEAAVKLVREQMLTRVRNAWSCGICGRIYNCGTNKKYL